jgi:tetratricopeptide (TPR) repeat protein
MTALEAAVRAHKAGALADAERQYRALLEREPDNAKALYLLGTLAHQNERHEEGLRLLSAAIAQDPANAAAYNNRAQVHEALGMYKLRLADLERAVELDPGYAEALHNLGNALATFGRFDEAEASFRKAIAAAPGFAEPHCGLATLLRRRERADEALAAFETALRLKPNFIAALMHLCEMPECRDDAALAARAAEGIRRAAAAALARDPMQGEALHNCAIALVNLGRAEEAFELLRGALARDPQSARLHNALGAALRLSGAAAAAIPHYRRALALDPGFVDAGFNLAMALLVTGDWRAGWEFYEYRLRRPEARGQPARIFPPEKRWQGDDLSGRTLLVDGEQGLGDTLQFARFVPVVARRARSVVLVVQRPLLGVLRAGMPPNVSVVSNAWTASRTSAKGHKPAAVPRPAGEPPYDFFVPLLSVPLALGIGEAGLATAGNYLSADPAKVRAWGALLEQGQEPALRIGFVWAGSPGHKGDLKRSIGIRLFAPLFAVPGIRCYSLQLGPRAGDLARDGITAVVSLSERITDFSETLAVLGNLDLLITVDTAAAHAAGAIGTPVWLLLPYVPDWRWGLEGETTPWYPSMRLFRQDSSRRWEPVIARVAAALGTLVRCTTPKQRGAGFASGAALQA